METRAHDPELLLSQIQSLMEGAPNLIAGLANVSSALMESIPLLNWAGFYLLDQGRLVLGPFCGRVACTLIPLGKGVCGTATKEDRILRVDDVHRFEGHIACDNVSRSELVVPIHVKGAVIGVLDLDSPVEGRFQEEDEALMRSVGQLIDAHADALSPAYSLN